MQVFDLGIVWNWKHDADFINDLNKECLKEGLKPYIIHSHNFYSTVKNAVEGNISFNVFFGRILNYDPLFNKLPYFLTSRINFYINHPEITKRTRNNYLMYQEFIKNKIPVPVVIILDPRDDNQTLELKIRDFPNSAVIKANSGTCETEVVLDTTYLSYIKRLKEQYGNVLFLAQEKILPINLDDKPALFRVLYCFGEVIPCWIDPVNCTSEALTLDEVDRFNLSAIFTITKKISNICKLEFFSIEITMKDNKEFVVTSYINDQADMRKKSKFSDGIPDEVISNVIKAIVSIVKQRRLEKGMDKDKDENDKFNHNCFIRN